MPLAPHQQRRRQAAQAARVASAYKQGKRLGLMDPLFNLRELCKHLCLLEDHLAQQHKRCPDCIRKHLLTIEALADEAVALDPCGMYVAVGGRGAELAQEWAAKLVDGTDPTEVAKEVRQVRKLMTPLVFDPRGTAAIQRVAAVHTQRVEHRKTPGVPAVMVREKGRTTGQLNTNAKPGTKVRIRSREYVVQYDPGKRERFIDLDRSGMPTVYQG